MEETHNKEKLTLNGYQSAAMGTALAASLNTAYMAYGLVNEIGELQEKFISESSGMVSSEDTLKELGDVLWYIAGVSHIRGWKLSEVMTGIVTDITINEYEAKEFAKSSDSNSRQDSNVILSINLSLAAGSLCGALKKEIRDNAHKPDVEKEALRKIFQISTVLAKKLGSTLEHVATANIAKLASRKARGVIGGNGDNR